MTKDLLDIAGSIQSAYNQMYSDGEVRDISEKMEHRNTKTAGKGLHTNPNKHLSASEKKSLASISRMNKGDYSHVSKDDEKGEETPKPRKRTTDMKKVIVAHYLYDEGYTETLESAEVMAQCISEEWESSILELV